MRVTGGRYKGRRIECPPGIIRPTMDKMREALFSILGSVEGLSVLDLFSGSGSVGIEAASRGAREVVIVEKDAGKRAIIKRNISVVEESIALRTMPVERFILRAARPFAVIFCDPPYAYEHKEDLLLRIGESALCDEHSTVAIHHPAKEELAAEVGPLRRTDSRKYGNARLSFYRRDA